MSGVKKIAVIGGGIIGISSALAIYQEVPDVKITVFAASYTPDTTGDGAAGLWMPYLLGKGSQQKTSIWAKKTFAFLQDLFLHEPQAGVSLMSGFCFDSDESIEPFWKNIVLGYSSMSQDELNLIGCTKGIKFTTFITECRKLLPFLMRKLENYGCTFVKRKVESINELLEGFDMVINSPGVMARHLVKDSQVYPIRGQITKVVAPWIKMFYITDDHYIIPNSDFVVLGGTHQEENWSKDANETDRNHIISGCSKIIPSLKKATILTDWVGLRPGRSEVRLEIEKIGIKKVIHNYGHGGSGVTVFWGCAQHTAQLVKDAFSEVNVHSQL